MNLTSEEKELETRLLELLSHTEQAIKKLDEELDFGSDVDSFDEESDETEEFANQIGVRAALKTQRERVTRALERMKQGTYGICVSCGKPIEKDLLIAVPEPDLCKTCKQKTA